MLRGPLSEKDYRPSFSGHETFPLRYGWLKKAYDVIINEDHLNNKTIFTDEMAVSRFGVGKNMVSSIYHWCLMTGIIEEDVKTKNLKEKWLKYIGKIFKLKYFIQEDIFQFKSTKLFTTDLIVCTLVRSLWEGKVFVKEKTLILFKNMFESWIGPEHSIKKPTPTIGTRMCTFAH